MSNLSSSRVMGGQASKELQAAQRTVRALTQELDSAKSSLAGAVGSRVEEVSALKLRSKVMLAELQSAKSELETTAARLKSEQQERMAVMRLSGALKSQVEEEKKRAQELNSRLIVEAASAVEAAERAAEAEAAAEAAAQAVELRGGAGAGNEDPLQPLPPPPTSGAAPPALRHPVFGKLLVDLGYKRVFLANPVTLWAATPVWEKQRAFRQDRAARMAKSKLTSVVEGWPGSITVVTKGPAVPLGGGGGGMEGGVEGVEGGVAEEVLRSSIIDGQHRLGASQLMDPSALAAASAAASADASADASGGAVEGGALLVDALRERRDNALKAILVEVYADMDDAGVRKLFVEINKSEPVKLVDLPDVGASERDQQALMSAAEELRTMFTPMFKVGV